MGAFDQGALPLYQRTLKIRERVWGRNTLTPPAASTIWPLIGPWPPTTRPCPCTSVPWKIRNRPLEHPDTSVSLNNLAMLYHRRGRMTKPLCPAVPAGAEDPEKVLGPEDPATATSLSSTVRAGTRRSRPDAKAVPLHQRALQIMEKTFEPDHP